MVHNEDSRVKIPSILHLSRLGYKYLSLKNATWDLETNIFTDIFREKLADLNPNLEEDEITRFIEEVKLSLANEDLGKEFYIKLTSQYVPVPPDHLAEKFYEFMQPLQAKKQKNLVEIKEMGALRDWLLPMLMNGQVNVGQTENFEMSNQLEKLPIANG